MSNIQNWEQQPYSSNQSAFGWFLFVGLIVVAIGFWDVFIADMRKLWP
jgi:hypothetical protein